MAIKIECGYNIGAVQEFPAPANGRDYSLEELRAGIGGGYIQIIGLSDGRLMVMDEEGKFKYGLNEVATDLAKDVLFEGDYIAGDVLVVEDSQIE